MKGIIVAPKKIITGAFNIRLEFIRPIELSSDDVRVETLEGAALGHTKDRFTGEGARYLMLSYPPEGAAGKSRISVPGHDVPAVEIEYDTVREIDAVFLDPSLSESGQRVEVPVLCVGVAIQRLRKSNIEVSPGMRIQIYGEDGEWTVSVKAKKTPVSLKTVGRVRKTNGVRASLREDTIRVDASEL